MIITHTKKFLGTPFIIETMPIENRPGTWNSTRVSIYRNEVLIGEYIRNYSRHSSDTFYPFIIDNKWYALYSANYTATRVMRLYNNRIEDWCGEDGDENGFCPAEFYIPKYAHSRDSMLVPSTGETSIIDWYDTDCDINDSEFTTVQQNSKFIELAYCNFGFISGCIWGDDSSWKIRYIDLAQIPNKIINITEKFGYWEIPCNMVLKQCINMANWEPDHRWINLTRAYHINLDTGEKN